MNPIAEAWLRDGRATRLPDELSAGFEAYLATLEWFPSEIDMRRMPPVESVHLDEASPDELAAWLARSRIGRHSHLAIWYSGKQGGIVVELHAALRDLDELYSTGTGTFYAFAVDLHDGEIVPAYADLLEYRLGELRAISAAPQWPQVQGRTSSARVRWTASPPLGDEYTAVSRFDDPRDRAVWFHVVLRFRSSREHVEVGVLEPDLPRHVLAPGASFALYEGKTKVADVILAGDPVAVTSWIWIFMGAKGQFPSGVFTDIGPAHAWASTNRLTGTLTRYPVDTGTYDWAVTTGLYTPKHGPASPDFIGRFSTASQEHYHYEDGVCRGLDPEPCR